MKTLKTFSLIALALVFLIAPLAAQTAPPAQASEAAQAAATNAASQQQTQQEAFAKAQQSAQEREKEFQKQQEEQRKQIEAQRKKAEAEQYDMEALVRTYSLKFVNPNDLIKAAKFYVYDSTASGSTLTVRVPRKYVGDFETLLRKLDVEKKNIQLQVYTVVASKETPPERYKANFVSETRDVANAELKRVLDEMKGLWNFKYYWVENPSFLTVKDGAEGNSTKLVSGSFDFEMRLRNVELRGDDPGKRIIAAGAISLYQTLNTQRSALIETSDITFKEKGYLVVGVSGLQAGWQGAALILIISADVK
jgi:hypothetical protein